MECGKVERVKGKVWVGTVQVRYTDGPTHTKMYWYTYITKRYILTSSMFGGELHDGYRV